MPGGHLPPPPPLSIYSPDVCKLFWWEDGCIISYSYDVMGYYLFNLLNGINLLTEHARHRWVVISSSNVVRGCSQLSTFSLAYSFSWTLAHPESVQEDDPDISSGVIALFVFSVLGKPRIRLNQNLVWTKFGVNSYVGFPRWSPGGHIWSPIEPKFGRNVGGV
jgi:hypothetical protein